MKSNRILICFLVLTIVLSTISPILAFAEDDGETMITITSAEDLFHFSERVNNGEADLDAILTVDITLGAEFIPIGVDTPYNGEFNGNGHTITLNMTTPKKYAGVFGIVDVNGKVLNLKTSGIVSGTASVGGIAGYSKGKIYNCSNDAIIISSSNDAGGIVGETSNNSVTEICSNYSVVSGEEKYIGGIVGRSRGSIYDCYNTANVSGLSNVGGVAGAASSGTIKNSFSYSDNGNIYGYKSTSVTVTNCYYLGGGADGLGVSASKFASGYIAHYLNTTALTETNRGVWAQGTNYPVFATDENKPVYEVTFNFGMQEIKKYTKSNGTVEFPLFAESNVIWYRSGNEVDENTIVTGDWTFEGASENSSNTAVSVVIPKDGNNIPFDIKPMFENNFIYFFMPSTASLNSIKYNLLDKNGEIIQTVNADFTTDEIHTASLSYGEYEIKALKSTLPALFLNIDETYGEIDAMNSSVDHSVSCYGDLKLVVPDNLKEKYGWADVTSIENDNKNPGSMNMKGRGNSSWSAELGVKKAYQIKLEKKTSLLGMDKAKKWCLLRDNVDLYKNALAFDLAREMNMNHSCESEYSDVYMNGEYLGTYLITDKIEIGSASVDITNLDDAFEENGNSLEGIDITGGYLLEIDNTTDDLQFITQGNKITIKGPEDLAKTASLDGPYRYIIETTQDLFKAIYNDGYLEDGSHFMEHINIESFVKYFWHQELLGNKDCGSGSTYLYKDADNVDPKFYAGPVWDNDFALTQAEGWILPNLKRGNKADGKDIFYNALCKHREFISYAVHYYETELNEQLKKAPEILSRAIAKTYTSETMNALRWGKDNKQAAANDVAVLNQRIEWIEENYQSLKEFATKGSFKNLNQYNITAYTPYGGKVIQNLETAVKDINVVLTAEPKDDYEFVEWVVEHGGIELPNTPTVHFSMPENDVTVKAIFRDTVERETIASYNFSEILGTKAGYTPNIGNAKLTVSADGTNKSVLRLNTDDFASSVAVFSGTDTIPYGHQSYIDIEFDARKYENIAFSADIGGKNAAPLSWKVMYSTDGVDYTELENSVYTLTKAFTMKNGYYHVKVPVANSKTAHIRLVTNETFTVDGGSFDGAVFGEAAIDNIEISGIDTGREIPADPISITASATRIMDKIVLQLNTDKKLTNEILHYAFYDNSGKYVDYGVVPVIKANDEFYIVLNNLLDAKYARLFIWKNLNTLVPLSETIQVEIAE